jgi:hypothetical protein
MGNLTDGVFCVQALSDASEGVGGERVSQGGARGRAVEQVRGGLIEREKRVSRERRESLEREKRISMRRLVVISR